MILCLVLVGGFHDDPADPLPQILRRAQGNQAPPVQDADPAAEDFGLFDVVGGQENGDALPVEAPDQVPDPAPHLGV